MTPTPAHQAFREKRKEAVCPRPQFTGEERMAFLLGMEAEHEVAYLQGQADFGRALWSRMEDDGYFSKEIIEEGWKAVHELEAVIAALLEGK